MQTHWPEDVVEEIVNSFIVRKKVKTIVTFDPYGVSSHINHMAVCAGVRRVGGVTRLELKSTTLLRKFIGPIEAWVYYLLQVSCKWVCGFPCVLDLLSLTDPRYFDFIFDDYTVVCAFFSQQSRRNGTNNSCT